MSNFVSNMFSAESSTSSKRVIGAICIFVFLMLTSYVVFKELKIDDSAKFLIALVAYLGGGLIGLGLADNIKLLK